MKLKPCPLCGAKADKETSIRHSDKCFFSAYMDVQEFWLDGGVTERAAYFVKLWNTRKEPKHDLLRK